LIFRRPHQARVIKFRFPIVIIDENFRSDWPLGAWRSCRGRGDWSEGFEVLGATVYGDPRETSRHSAAGPCGCDAVKPRIITLTQSTYDGFLYNAEMIQDRCNILPTALP